MDGREQADSLRKGTARFVRLCRQGAERLIRDQLSADHETTMSQTGDWALSCSAVGAEICDAKLSPDVHGS